MAHRKSKTASSGLTAAALIVLALALSAAAGAQPPHEQQPPHSVPHSAPHTASDIQDHPQCTIDLANAGHMKDIVSNALNQGLDFPEGDVAIFLVGAEESYANGPELLKAAAKQFKLDDAVLAAEVEKFKHINCRHAGGGEAAAPGAEDQPRDDGTPVSAFAKDVTLHVVLHEMGHALIREFDIPILGNEETAADAFATYYLTTYMADRAVDVLTARITSLMIEADEATQVDWSGEHDHDARRAYQIAALAVAADPLKYKSVAAVVAMSEEDMRKARDYGAEIRRSWRRVLGPLLMPEGAASSEARVLYDPDIGFLNRLCSDGLASEIESAVKRFDWHSQVTVRFVDGDGGAAWSRSGRTITVHSEYVRRFVEQGGRGLPGAK
jgi:hypothetical protein